MWQIVGFLLIFTSVGAEHDVYTEELVIARLPTVDHTALNFRFEIKTDDLFLDPPAYNLFPRVIGDVVRDYKLDALSLSLTQGYYRVPQWGYAVQPSRPNGAMVHAVFDGDQDEASISNRWRRLIDALSGFFCASLRQMEPVYTTIPNVTRLSSGSLAERRALLGSENVCTENLTPWKKLLPCKKSGLVVLLNAESLVANAHHYSLGVDVAKDCPTNKKPCSSYKVTLTLTVVERFPGALGATLDWRLSQYFGSALPSVCPLADRSTIAVREDRVLYGGKENPMTLTPSPSRVSHSGYHIYDLHADEARLFGDGAQSSLIIKAAYAQADRTKVDTVLPIRSPAVTISSFIAGTGVYAGRIVSTLTNDLPTYLTAKYSHTLPWFLRVFFHTMVLHCDGMEGNERIVEQHFASAVDRGRPSLIELVLHLPAHSQCRLSLKFERAFLRWNEYPPDAQHGFHVPPASLTFTDVGMLIDGAYCMYGNQSVVDWRHVKDWTTEGKEKFCHSPLTVYSEPLLVIMPVPDFSMPYNVLCLVCTVLALAFGPIHNLTTRSFALLTTTPKSLRRRFIDHLKRKLGMKVTEGTKSESKPSVDNKPTDDDKTEIEPTIDLVSTPATKMSEKENDGEKENEGEKENVCRRELSMKKSRIPVRSASKKKKPVMID